MANFSRITFSKAFPPIAFFILLMVYGLFLHPFFVKGEMLSLEILLLISICFSSFYMMYLGYSWETIQEHIVKKTSQSLPIVLVLFAIGVLIGSWMVSGTIPMLIYYGISIISPSFIYIYSFLICIAFSLLTGTSWGSAGTIGVVMVSITQVFDANLAITAGAVVGGSFFGDKLSPLSDTTNLVSLATDTPLYNHIYSMIFTTVPSAILAALLYIYLSPSMQGSVKLGSTENLEIIQNTLNDLDNMFNFNILLLLPMVVVIYGTLTKKSIFLTLLSSAWVAVILAYFFQDFGTINNIFTSLKSGFNTQMSVTKLSQNSPILDVLNRGGLYNLIEGIIVSVLVFIYIGTLNVIDAIEVSVKSLMKKIKKRHQLVVAALTSTLITNAITSSLYASCFIIGNAFKKKFDDMGVDRKVLSRSIEDAGTMLESLMPWTPTGVFMAVTLGVGTLEYAPYQFLSLINIFIAYFFAFTGIACFYNNKKG